MSGFVNTLSAYIDSRYPIIYINHYDTHILDDALDTIKSPQTRIVAFDNAYGEIDFVTRSPANIKVDLPTFLEMVRADGYDNDLFIVLYDIHKSFDNPQVVSLLKRIAEDNLATEDYNATVFVVSSVLTIPPELESYMTIIDMPLPTEKDIIGIMEEFAGVNGITIGDNVVGELALSLKGLNRLQVNQILNLAFNDGGNITQADKQLVVTEKKQIVKKNGMIEYIDVLETMGDIGGLDKLKEYLRKKAKVFKQLDEALKFGVTIPKGILIIGMPGCGKSLAAKATANLFEVPIARLDVGKLLGKYVGESEDNMRRALKLAEAISPCVLWIDEIEKAFAGIGQGGGASDITTRLFGQFLTWMQEKTSVVYIVATANTIDNIPAEFLRKGRFDELFFVDLPDKDERKAIIKIHLKKCGKFSKDIDLSKAVGQTDGYSGADLQSIVTESIETAFSDGKRAVTTDDLLDSIKNNKSISDILKDKLNAIYAQVKKMDFKRANNYVRS